MWPTHVIISNSQNPFVNLAYEKWAIEHLDTNQQDYLLLYVNKPSVVVGRNQNIYEEVNVPYCKQYNIHICRRISGGGTVYHDEGNVNWSFFTKRDLKKVNNYSWAVKAIFHVLELYGLNPYLTSRNAIEIDGLKICGQAQFTTKNNLMSHGTLLINSKRDFLQKAIEPAANIDYVSKASASVRSKTGNVSAILGKEIRITQFIEDLIQQNGFNRSNINVEIITPSEDIQLMNSHAWLQERCPKFEALHKGIIYSVEKGIIRAIKKGSQIIGSPFLNKDYEDFLFSVSSSSTFN